MTSSVSTSGHRGNTAARADGGAAADEVVITGVGAVSALGSSAGALWQGLLRGETGIRPLEEHDGRPPTIGARVRDFDPRERIRSTHRRRMDRLSAMIVSAAREALDDAGLDVERASDAERARVAVSVGSAFGNLSDSMSHVERLFGRGARAVSPMTFPNLVLNAPASYVAMELGVTGANMTVSQLELSGEQAILTAHDLLRARRADVVVAGGGDELAPITAEVHRQARALSGQRGGREWSSPYDRGRNGVVLGEGAGMLVLETHEHAARRGAHVYAAIEGVASASIAATLYSWPKLEPRHDTWLPPALSALVRGAATLDLVCGSANSSPVLDASELVLIEAMIERLAEPRPTAPWLTSIKGATGEFGAAGALTTIAAAMALDRQRVPRLGALTDPERCHALRYAAAESVESELERALVTGLARGGSCTALLLRHGVREPKHQAGGGSKFSIGPRSA